MRTGPFRRIGGNAAGGARLRLLTALALICGGGLTVLAPPAVRAAAGPCDPGGNPIACENSKPGAPSSEWEKLSGGGQTIEGYTTSYSVDQGQTVQFKINTPATGYSLAIYRMGHYAGMGARKIADVSPSATLPQHQPPCASDNATGLVDCGNWAVSASWQVPAASVSGIYFAHIVRTDGVDDDNHIVFVVRDDDSHSDVVFKTSDTTWQAYNRWGGNSLYAGDSTAAPGRAVKVSYNRPFSTRENTPWGRDFVFANEYPMVRFLEANGYDVSYMGGLDADVRGQLIKNHKLFLSVGHDEYWSGTERANVESARDAGVHLGFFSGNEVYWKTRWENSISGPSTPNRTLVTYKETRDNAKTDPSPQWTGTWRDPRFSPPADGGRPENALTGTIFSVNCCGVALKVPAADGKMRLWRGTPVASQSAGATATLAAHTLGYEWDEDLDNGSRPKGLFRMSSTTADVEEKLIDFGSEVAPGNATHHLTMYRAPSGALVFGAGTVQWTWGLDAEHDGHNEAPTAPDPNMRQATVNLFADMGTQPSTLQTGLTAATASADTTPPTSSVSSPLAESQLINGNTVTISGTAADVGGQVAGVEVSTDGGTTWHPATGRANWTYKWDAAGNGPVTIKTRAVDDSGRIETPGAGTTVVVGCPCKLFGASTVPDRPADSDTTSLEAGVKFRSSVAGWVSGVRFYKGTGNTGTHVGSLWKADGTKLASATFTGETSSGWQTASFATAVHVDAATTYVVSYYAPNGHYAADANYFSLNDHTTTPLTAFKTGTDGPNGVYRSGSTGFPTSTYNGGNYYVDVVFDTIEPPDTAAPTIVDNTPFAGSSSVPTSVHPSVTFNEPVQTSTPSFTLKNGTTTIAGSVNLNAARTGLTFTPSSALPNSANLTVTVKDAKDDAGNTMQTFTYTFKTAKPAPQPGQCPCSIWPDDSAPAVEGVNDPSEVELGVRFTADANGAIEGVRFYKGRNNDGTHVGTLWTAAGQQLATATFTNESTLGWQEVTFGTPVQVTAGTTYVASYHTTKGWYSTTSNGLGQGADNAPLHAIPDTWGAPGNGLYKYGTRSFPNQSFGGSNYWVDVVFRPPPDTTPPTVSAKSPSSNATSVPTGSAVKVTFSEALQAGTATFALAGPGGGAVAGSAALDSTGKVLTFTPSAALTAATTYTASVSGAKDLAGNTMSGTTTWPFTTSGSCPCTIWPSDATPGTPAANDNGGVELGVKFNADNDGWVSGVRFYKGPGNTGTHVGSLWDTGGTRLATGTFTGETSSGWQTLVFASPIQVTAGTTYVASYFAPNGHYAADAGGLGAAFNNAPLHALSNGASGGNGLYAYGSSSRFPNSSYGASNYWVDAVYSTVHPGDTTRPTIDSVDPVNGATSVPRAAKPAVTFDEPVQSGTIQLTLTGPGGAPVAGSVSYDAATRTAKFTPSASLAWHTGYTTKVEGVKDLAGNALQAPYTWSFTTAKQTTAGQCPCSVWPDETQPQVANVNDPASIELGMKFRADSNGWVTGARFYKGSQNTGTHTASLWSTNGTRLATATFTGESAAGWQEVQFGTPVQVTTNTTYVVSYLAPDGHYSADSGAFTNAGVDSPPLTALQSGLDGPNGVYLYGSGGFPATASTSNYWVDVLFTTTAP